MQKRNAQSSIKRPDEHIKFEHCDFEVMDLALNHIPELRLCAGIVKAARGIKLQYPIKSTEQLIKLMPKKEIFIEGHHIRAALIERYMPNEYFPITNERELITRCYLALMRCKDDIAWAARAPSYANILLKEYATLTKQKGEA